MSSKEYRALQLLRPRALALGKMIIDGAPAGGLLAEVLGCAVCGTDLKVYRGDKEVASDVLGHEFVARIVEVGQGVESFRVGERITVATTISCGQCCFCQDGLTNLCQGANRMGLDFPGAFADVLEIPALALQRGNVLHVPQSLPDDLAVLAEPLSCVINGQQLAEMRPGLDVLVVGGGPIGLLHVQAARRCGARRIILAGTNETRLKMAERFDADVRVNPTKEDLIECVSRLTDGLGVDLAVVCAPNSKAIRGLTAVLRKGGTLSLFAGLSVDDSEFPLDGRAVHYGQLRLVGASDSRPDHFVLAMRMLEAFPESFRPLITHTFPLDQAAEAFRIIEKGRAFKVVLVPGATE